MRFIADENISPLTVEFLISPGHDVLRVSDVMRGSRDEEIVDFVIREDRTIITLDMDFGRMYYFSKRGAVRIVVVREHPATVENVNAALAKFLSSVGIEKAGACLVILDKKRIRIRK